MNVPTAKLMTPPTSSSLIVSVAVSRPATRTAPAPGLLSVRFTTLSGATTLLSMMGTGTSTLPLPAGNVTVDDGGTGEPSVP